MRSLRFLISGLALMLLVSTPAFAQKYVCMESNQGEWCMELLRSAAPNTVTNFLRYVTSGDYNSSLIHRSEPGFVIQGGGFTWIPPAVIASANSYGMIKNEFSRSNLRGTVAMAQLSGNPNSASNQWFINLDNNSALDSEKVGSFTVFAEVVYGMDVVDKIAGFRRVDLSNDTGISAFKSVPTSAPQGGLLDRSDLVIVNRVYTSDSLPVTAVIAPYHCTAAVQKDALSELCSNAVSIPVQIVGGGKYDAVLDLVSSQPQLVFAVRAGSLKPQPAPSTAYASFDASTNELLIPSVRVGAVIYDNVKLKLTSTVPIQFTLQSFTQR